jgi:hypothetical protein
MPCADELFRHPARFATSLSTDWTCLTAGFRISRGAITALRVKNCLSSARTTKPASDRPICSSEVSYRPRARIPRIGRSQLMPRPTLCAPSRFSAKLTASAGAPCRWTVSVEGDQGQQATLCHWDEGGAGWSRQPWEVVDRQRLAGHCRQLSRPRHRK